MKKTILNLQGAQELSKNEQKAVNGGRKGCNIHSDCGPNMCCGYFEKVCGPINNNVGFCDGRNESFPEVFLP